MKGKEFLVKWKYFIYIGIPVGIGILYFLLMQISYLDQILYYSGYIPLVCFWCWAGTQFAQKYEHMWKTTFAANALVLFFFLIYLWQFMLHTDATRNLLLAGVSQIITAPLTTFVLRFLYLTKENGEVLSQGTAMLAEGYSVLILLFLFSFGFFGKSRTMKRTPKVQAAGSIRVNRAARRKKKK